MFMSRFIRYPLWTRNLPAGISALYENYWCTGEEVRPPHKTVSEDISNFLLWLWEDRDCWNLNAEDLAFLQGFYAAKIEAPSIKEDLVCEKMGDEIVAIREEGQPDNLGTRIERWEKANNRKIKDLSPSEWVRVINNIGCMTESEAWELLNSQLNHL